MRMVYRGKKRTALYKGNLVALMVVKASNNIRMTWVNPTQKQVDNMLDKYQVFLEAGGKKACAIQLRKRGGRYDI